MASNTPILLQYYGKNTEENISVDVLKERSVSTPGLIVFNGVDNINEIYVDGKTFGGNLEKLKEELTVNLNSTDNLINIKRSNKINDFDLTVKIGSLNNNTDGIAIVSDIKDYIDHNVPKWEIIK